MRLPALLLAAALAAPCQEQAVLDLVVRDAGGRLVRDLQASEVEIRENGAARPIHSLRRQEAGQPRLVTILFGDPDAAESDRACDLARRFASRLAGPHTLAGIFLLGDRLNILQPFTSEEGPVKATLDQIPGSSRDALVRASLAIERSGQAGPAGIDAARLLAGNRLDLNLGPRSSAGALLSLLHLFRAQASWPGPKTALYLSTDGLPVDPASEDLFRGVIAEANRARIAVYGLDARPLISDDSEPADATGPLLPPIPLGLDAEIGLDYEGLALDRLFRPEKDRRNPFDSLGELTRSTGGFLIGADRTDALLREAEEDAAGGYTVAYTRASAGAGFRTISVTLSRPGLTAHSPTLEGPSILPFEAAASAALGASAPPRGLDYRFAAIRFRPGPRRVRYSLVFEAPGIAATVAEDKQKGVCRLHLSFAVRIRDAAGAVVDTVAGDLPYEAPLEYLAALRWRSKLTFGATVDLPPGRYTLETAVADLEGGKAGERSEALTVPPARDSGPSDLVLARRVEPVPWSSPDDPLRCKFRVVPALEPFVRIGDSVRLYAVLYSPEQQPAQGRHLLVRGASGPARVELTRDGRVAASGRDDLNVRDEFDRRPLLGSFSTRNLAPDQYELRVRFGQEAATEETLPFTLR